MPESRPVPVLRDAVLTPPPTLTAGRPAWSTTPPADTSDAVRLLDDLLATAVRLRASDLHLEAGDQGATVRLRVDGVLRDGPAVPRALALPLASRLKILAGLDIADRLRPQDGRARVTAAGRAVELRVSTLPSVRGENLVVRLSDPAAGLESLEALGLLPSDAARLGKLLDAREGLILVTGPTGSGKTTTLYAALRRILERGGVNVITVEDPVERRLPGVVQIQIHDKAGLSFAAALRAILRQDPDVVLVGEVRDRETASIAAQAAMTGHLVLATLHTVDAASAVTRLADVGVEPFKLAAALRGVVAQRLVRRLCAACRRAVAPGWRDARLAGRAPEGALCWQAPPPATAGADRCPACDGAGYRGRVAALEILVADDAFARLVASGGTHDALTTAARRAGTPSVWDSAVSHVRTGATSVSELLRALDVPVDAPPTATPPARSVP
ncbi:putative type II secretion system protein HxcR [Gemmatimonadetes bacterium T265]|nr:putative type II secretion system protein HxcR [Gemmatimonadetes bacterium T265]